MACGSLASFFFTIAINNTHILDTTLPEFHALAILTLALSTLFAFTDINTFLLGA